MGGEERGGAVTASHAERRCIRCEERKRADVGRLRYLLEPVPKQALAPVESVKCAACGFILWCLCDDCVRTRRRQESAARKAAYLAGSAAEKGVLKAVDRAVLHAWNFFLD